MRWRDKEGTESVKVIRRVTGRRKREEKKKRRVNMFGDLGHCPQENCISLSLFVIAVKAVISCKPASVFVCVCRTAEGCEDSSCCS